MLSFKSFISEQYQELSEKLITFAGQAYPKFGQVVIMAGGAGSGKDFVLSNLVGVEGYTFDVDALKSLASKAPMIQQKVKSELGVDLTALSSNLKNPENVQKLHAIMGEYLNLDDKKLSAFYQSALQAPADRKPNVIFDVTLSDLRKLEKICSQVKLLGYDPKNIHIVWVINDIEIAKEQNAKRARTVPAEILVNTHRGAANSMKDILAMGTDLKKYMDGDIVFAFNKVKVDAEYAKSKNGGGYVRAANFFYVKHSGKPVMSLDAIKKDVRAKIASYVPKDIAWV